jgi:hypothetical protein
MEPIKLFIEGDPVPKQSFRVVIKKQDGKVQHGFQPARVKGFAEAVGWAAREKIKEPLRGHIHVEIYFYLKNTG